MFHTDHRCCSNHLYRKVPSSTAGIPRCIPFKVRPRGHSSDSPSQLIRRRAESNCQDTLLLFMQRTKSRWALGEIEGIGSEHILAPPGDARKLSGLRIVRLVANYPVGGKSSYGLQPVYHNLSKAQVKRGRDVHVVARRSAGQPSYEEVSGIKVHRVKTPYNISAMLSVVKLANEGPPTVIHTHSTSGVFLSLSKRATSTPVVSHVHGTTISAATPAVLRFGRQEYGYSPFRVATSYMRERVLWASADRVAAVSSSVVSDLTTRYGIDENKIRLVYNGVDPATFRPNGYPVVPEQPFLEGRKVVLYIGHFGLRKGLPVLIEAMKSVTKEVKDAVLLCVGGVPAWLPKGEYLDYLKRLVTRNDLEGKAMFLGSLPQGRLPAYYCLSSVFVLPSYYEAFPKVLVEAMACEKPVVTSKMGGTSDSVEDGVNGFLVPFGNSKGLADAILTLLQDETLSRKMGRIGRERVLRDFTWDAVAGRLDSIYSELVAG